MCSAAVFDSASLPLIEEYYAKFKADPDSVGPEWKAYFLGWLAAGDTAGAGSGNAGLDAYVDAWRRRGHLAAWVNPLDKAAPELPRELQPETYGLSAAETGRFAEVYGGHVGIESSAVRDHAERAWMQAWWEGEGGTRKPAKDVQLRLYEGLVRANALERFLHTKFVGAKRFSVEGSDGIVPLLLELAGMAAAGGTQSMVLGMAHRGRLNVLCNILHKPLNELFAAFADKLTTEGGASSGDVKYHLGKTYTAHVGDGEIELQLLFNPSHLEAVNPSVLGVARAKIDKTGGDAGKGALAVLIHGDSAVAGQGTVAETNNLMGLAPYDVGGTLHFVLNNQVGFTADPRDAYAVYCTDGMKGLGVPIIHVNADDIEACWRAVCFAWEYRQQFGKDVVLDLVGYRRWGHNEGDDPTFTQPLLYAKIKGHPVPAEVYKQKLLAEGVDPNVLAVRETTYNDELNKAFGEAQKGIVTKGKEVKADTGAVETVAEAGQLKAVAGAWGLIPAGFVFNDKVHKVVEERQAMLRGEKPLNWGAAETAAYGVLLQEGISVRMSGQDAQRGTFSHRHAVLTGGMDNQKWNVLQALSVKGARAGFYNSSLSENGVMGFEYGYALAAPETLVIWEGQFGDFANGAQVVIDQFMASAEAKWGQLDGLTLLLPHGYEGQGPEHSSARLERYLQLSAENNWRVCYPSTPAQIFHLLRNQAKHAAKRPLVVMTPKSLLRNPAAVSNLSELMTGGWQQVLDDTVDAKAVKRVVLCSGKVYYDLLARRDEEKRSDVAIVRVEQLYPWPAVDLARVLGKYKAKDVTWVQEEPRNMGAWSFVREAWDEGLGYLHYVGRPASASPAVGTTVRHNAEQKAIVDEVFEAGKAKKVA